MIIPSTCKINLKRLAIPKIVYIALVTNYCNKFSNDSEEKAAFRP